MGKLQRVWQSLESLNTSKSLQVPIISIMSNYCLEKTLHTSWISEWFESPLVFCLMHFRLRCLDSKVVTTATALPWEVMSHTFTGSNPVKGMQRWLDMMFSEDYYVAAFHALSYPVHPMYATFVHTSASGYVSSLFLALGRCFHPKNGPSHLWLTHDEVHNRSLSGDHLM